jgi:uncharacterized protein involved in outer membrane biogenesis
MTLRKGAYIIGWSPPGQRFVFRFFKLMKWLKRVGIALLVLIAILAAVPFFITLNDYIPTIEREVSARIQEPVSIENLRVSGLPVPHLTIDGITIGSAEDVTVGKVVVTPDLWSLLRAVRVIRSIELRNVVLTPRALAMLPAWSQSDAGPTGVRIESIRLDDAIVRLERGRFGPFDAWVRVNASGEPEDASLITKDGAFHARITPRDELLLLDIAARGWTPPIGPPVRFDEVTIEGSATMQGAQFHHVAGRLFGGTINGKASLDWQKGLTIKGDLDVAHVELRQLGTLMSPQARLSGRINGKMHFNAAAPTAAGFEEALRVEAPFTVQNGILHGFDILGAATGLNADTSFGGETRFEQFSGHVVRDRGAYRITSLEIDAGNVAARGTLNISTEKSLSGQLNVSVEVGGRTVRVPLAVAGTIDTPVLLPSGVAKGTAAGAGLRPPEPRTAPIARPRGAKEAASPTRK